MTPILPRKFRAAAWGAARGHLFTLVMSAARVFLLGILFLADYPGLNSHDLLWLGTLWLGLSLVSELVLRRVVLGMGWREMLGDYDVRKGRLYLLLQLTGFLPPVVGYPLIFG